MRDMTRSISAKVEKVVRSQIEHVRHPISKKVENENGNENENENDGESNSLKFVETRVRPLWRAAVSGAKAPPLAARRKK